MCITFRPVRRNPLQYMCWYILHILPYVYTSRLDLSLLFDPADPIPEQILQSRIGNNLISSLLESYMNCKCQKLNKYFAKWLLGLCLLANKHELQKYFPLLSHHQDQTSNKCNPDTGTTQFQAWIILCKYVFIILYKYFHCWPLSLIWEYVFLQTNMNTQVRNFFKGQTSKMCNLEKRTIQFQASLPELCFVNMFLLCYRGMSIFWRFRFWTLCHW